ncbi:MAG: protein kinase [Rhodanobacteraceae bacterium]|nr:protein kinase [Rhodanobacteraceae bacterium]
MIDIPGYKVLKQLGRGRMATVYLALQESVDREVALKIMSPALMVDPNFGERFLREARIAAKLHHRHVVGVHDVGKHGDIHYIAMEFVAGGSAHHEDGKPDDPTYVLRVVREIATALGYAHSKGFVHRDVKPDNILMRDDGSSALTDFGIARANDSATRMTRTGAVIGTPHYMSPEQARGRPLDGRADLYSLGCVLYEMLMGRVPYQADDPLAVGIMHITEPVPKLSPHLVPIQPLLNRMMAKTPEERFQDGGEVAEAIREIEIDIAEGQYPHLATPDDAYRRRVFAEASRTQRLPTPPPDNEPVRGRSEPSFGDLRDMSTVSDGAARTRITPAVPQGKRPLPRSSQAPRRLWPYFVVVTLVAALAAGYVFRAQLAGLLPESDVVALLKRADAAVIANRLIEGEGNARDLYDAVLQIDSDNTQARDGIQRIGAVLITRADEARAGGNLDIARTFANEAEELLQGGQAIVELKARLQEAEAAKTRLDDLIPKAEAAFAAGNYVGNPDSAFELYQQVMSVDAANAIAPNGIAKILERLGERADSELKAGDLTAAMLTIQSITMISPNFAQLSDLKARLSEGQGNALDALSSDLGRAARLFADGALLPPSEPNALALYQSVLLRDPLSVPAKQGITRIGNALLQRARAKIADTDLDAADKLVHRAEALAPSAAELRTTKLELREARERRDIANNPRPVGPDEQLRLAEMLSRARDHARNGDLFGEPGQNAIDAYNNALRIDPKNAEAIAGMAALPARAKDLFEQAMTGNRLNAAYEYFDALRELSANDAVIPGMRDRLVRAYVDKAKALNAAGKTTDAKRAAIKARELAPDSPVTAELANLL